MAWISESKRSVLTLVLLAAGARLVVIAISLHVSGASLATYASIHDGREYQAIARSLDSFEKLEALARHNQRLFPGYPAAIRLAATALEMPLAALVVSVVCAVGATLLFHRLCGDFWLAAYFAVFTPSWLLFSAVAMSEGLFLLLALWVFSRWRSGSHRVAGFLAGILTLTRPIGAVFYGALWLVGFWRGDKKTMAQAGLLFLAAPVAWLVLAGFVWSDPLRQINVYVEADYRPPFLSLFGNLFSSGYSLAKRGLVAFTLVTNLAALVILAREAIETRTDEALGWLAWLASISLFLLALPSSWAFDCLDRFYLAALPPMLIGLRWLAPGRWWGVALAALVSITICVYWNRNMLTLVARTIS